MSLAETLEVTRTCRTRGARNFKATICTLNYTLSDQPILGSASATRTVSGKVQVYLPERSRADEAAETALKPDHVAAAAAGLMITPLFPCSQLNLHRHAAVAAGCQVDPFLFLDSVNLRPCGIAPFPRRVRLVGAEVFNQSCSDGKLVAISQLVFPARGLHVLACAAGFQVVQTAETQITPLVPKLKHSTAIFSFFYLWFCSPNRSAPVVKMDISYI